jgi:DedD protein
VEEKNNNNQGMNNQELNNILLEDVNEPSVSNSKKALMIGGALVVVFFVAIGVMRALNSGDDKNNGNNMILPPEPTKKVDDNPMFEKVPVKDSAQMDEKFEKIIKEIKQKTEPETQAPVRQAPTPTPVERPKPQPILPPATQELIQPASKIADTVSNDASKSGFYIQVGAFYSLEPSPKLLNNIKAQGYNYEIYKTKVNSKNITKVIVGPYATKNEAKNSLEDVRGKINKSAYILKVK